MPRHIFTLLARWLARIPTRKWYAIFSQSSVSRHAHRFRKPKDGCLIKLSLVLAAGQTPWGCFIRFWMIKRLKFSVLKLRAKVFQAACMRHRSPVGNPAFCMATAPICCKMTMARLPMRIQFRPGWIIPALGLNIPGCMTRGGSIMSAPPMMKRWLPFSYAPARKALFRRSNRRMRWPISAP